MNPQEMDHFKHDLARRIAAGAEWLLPWYLKIENETRQARSEQCELERVKRLGRQLETECGMTRNY